LRPRRSEDSFVIIRKEDVKRVAKAIVDAIERPYQLMAHSGVVGGDRGDKAAKRKAALTMAGGKYQEQLKRPWRTFRW
jgi:hypothetical protein